MKNIIACLLVTLSVNVFASNTATTMTDDSASTIASISAANIPTSRIVGGESALEVYPWMVSLQVGDETQGYGHFCGGVLIDANYILTAAHCLEDYNVASLKAVIGELNLATAFNSGTAEILNIDWRVRHHEYHDVKFYSDIAILHLATPSTKTPITRLTQSELDNLAAGTVVRAMGWGLTVDGGDSSDLPDVLQQADLELQSDSTCQSLYGEQSISGYWDRSLCAGLDDGSKDSCQGDSGGPLVYKNANDEWVLVGLVSWGVGCGVAGDYGVYSEVSAFADWIQDRQTGLSITGPEKIGFVGLGRSSAEAFSVVNMSNQTATLTSGEAILSNSSHAAGDLFAVDASSQTILAGNAGQVPVTALGHYLGLHKSAATLNFTMDDASSKSASSLLNSKVLYPLDASVLGVDWQFYSGTDEVTEHAEPWYQVRDNSKGNVLRSGVINDEERSVLLTYIDGAPDSVLKFDARVSALSGDYLAVLSYEGGYTPVDTNIWKTYSIDLAEGKNTVLFIYNKDAEDKSGSDAAFITNVRVCTSTLESSCSQAANWELTDDTVANLEGEVDEIGKGGNPVIQPDTGRKKSSGFGGLYYLLFALGLILLRRRAC